MNAFALNQIAVEVEYMGPARVVEARPGLVVARRSDGVQVDVTMALAFAYEPCERDVLLLISGSRGNFAIGVLDGKGKANLAIEGDVSLHAVGGRLSLKADRGVELLSPEVTIVSDKMKVIATSAMHKVSSLYQHVRELWSMKADKAHVAVKDDYFQRSKSATVLTEEVVTINGKQIHLG